ncbi:ubiquinone biosynthesis monooxygenase COQ6, mitochondrial [Thrips palmi]|uniref:Ubiquinone biosynthesis monooxygenase COQ6, mitochondrial n=1 Tax=Thrips palmi TaxID=161013 RepID=A0A6P8YU69_THRPL|nr:ubiquinone biosynthesis monooxygenase COQ6, mitochondrial [Thrips palmi]
MAPIMFLSPVTMAFSNVSKKLLMSHAGFICNSSLIQKCHQSTSGSQHYDIIIAGGGLVGTAMACALGSAKVLSEKKILLLEGAPAKPITLKDTYSNRVSAINHASVELFKHLSIWEDIRGHRVQEVRKMQVWETCSDSLITFSEDDLSNPVAYIIENDLMMWALSKCNENIPNSSVRYSAKIKDYAFPHSSDVNTPEVLLETGEKLSCDLLIGADGINSKVRSKMDTMVERTDYNQMGVVATLSLSDPTNNIVAWQRFLPDGVIALLPLSESTSSLVWSTSVEKAKSLIGLTGDSFVDAVNEAFLKEFPSNPFVESLLKNLNLSPGTDKQIPPSINGVQENSRAAFPLGSINVSRYVNDCVALIGDAAHRVHPLAGQGVNIGFGDVQCLADQVAKAAYQGSHIGKGAHLKVYQSERLYETLPKMKVIHFMHTLYKTSFTPAVVLRSLGLSLVQSMPLVKKQLIKRANS